LNGALTIGTLDGANVEMLDACRRGQHHHLRPDRDSRSPSVAPMATTACARSSKGRRNSRKALKAISSGVFSPGEPGRYRELIDGLYNTDWFMVAADFDAYADAQRYVDKLLDE
jgi:starch phosphorylase